MKQRWIVMSTALMMVTLLFNGCTKTEGQQNLVGDSSLVEFGTKIESEIKNDTEKTNTENGEKEYISVSQTKANYTDEALLERAELILRGTAVEKSKEWMRNPDGNRTDEQGNTVVNAQIAEYKVEIAEVYRGQLSEESLMVKVENGHGLSADLILYGEDDNYKLMSELATDELKIGEEAVFFLEYFDEPYNEEDGYYISACPLGYLPLNEDGTCSNDDGNSYSLKDLK